MRVRFWGTRGSIATPGAGTVRFGGNTSCVELQTGSGETFIFDVGTGARPLGDALMARTTGALSATILLTHTHWDHIQGFPFFGPLFVHGNRFAVYAPEDINRSLHQTLAGQMEFQHFPVELDQLPASITCHELTAGHHEIGGAHVFAQYLHHPTMTLGYRIEAGGVAVACLTDHEPFSDLLWRSDAPPGRVDAILHQGDRRHARFMANADLVIHDAQYTPEEFPAKKTWGHSTFDYVVELAAAAGVRRLALSHHDPRHDDAMVAEIEARARALAAARSPAMEVFCAFEGCELILEPSTETSGEFVGPSHARVATAARILVTDDDPDMRALARLALERDGHTVREAPSGEEAIRAVLEWAPDLVLLDIVMPTMSGLDVLRALRADPRTAHLPVLLLTSMDSESDLREGFEL